MTKKKLLIISYYFAPNNKIGSMRWSEMVPLLEQLGWECWVITTNSKGNLKVPIPENRILRFASSKSSNKFSISNIIKGKFGVDEFNIKILSKLGFQLRTINLFHYSWYKVVKQNLNVINDIISKPDVIISTYNPADNLWLGKYFSKKYNVPVIADFRDLAALLPIKRPLYIKKIDLFIEKNLLKNYNLLITVSNTLKNILYKKYFIDTEVIFNGWNESYLDKKKNKSDYLYYAGYFYPHRIKSLFLLLEALKNFPNIKLKIRSLGSDNANFKINKKLKILNLKNQVEVLEPTSLEIATKESYSSIANIVLEDLDKHNKASKGNLTGKFLRLLPISPAVLSIARNDNDMGKILKETNKGRLCSSVDEISSFLNEITKNKDVFKGNYKKILKYSKKEQAKKLANILNALVKE